MRNKSKFSITQSSDELDLRMNKRKEGCLLVATFMLCVSWRHHCYEVDQSLHLVMVEARYKDGEFSLAETWLRMHVALTR